MIKVWDVEYCPSLAIWLLLAYGTHCCLTMYWQILKSSKRSISQSSGHIHSFKYCAFTICHKLKASRMPILETTSWCIYECECKGLETIMKNCLMTTHS
jgi:hypothetical protein